MHTAQQATITDIIFDYDIFMHVNLEYFWVGYHFIF